MMKIEIKIFDSVKYNQERIFILGSGSMARLVTKALITKEIPISGYISEKDGKNKNFREILSWDTYREKYYLAGDIIIVACDNKTRFYIESMQKIGIATFYSPRIMLKDCLFLLPEEKKEYQEVLNFINDRFFIEDCLNNPSATNIYSLDVVVTERCSLKCNGCSNLMHYYENPKDCNVEEIIAGLRTLLSKVDRLFDMRIIGGEPFMNPHFAKIIEAFIDSKKIDRISIFSNATIFPEESILNLIRHPKIMMRLSDYGMHSKKIEMWKNWCFDNNISMSISQFSVWQDLGKLERHNYDAAKLIGLYGSCECRNLPTLIENKLFGCPYSAHAANLSAMSLEEINKDCLRIDEIKSSNEIEKFLYERDFLEACKYCNGRNYSNSHMAPFEQIKKSVPYTKNINGITKVDQDNSEYCGDLGLVSIVVSTYNAENTIEKCIRSIQNQTYKNLEIIIVDDGSTDKTVEVCKELFNSDFRVRLIANKHQGVVATRNIGIECSRGEYISFVDSDDWLSANRIANLIKDYKGADLVIASHIVVSDEDKSSDICMSKGQGKYKYVKTTLPSGVYPAKSYLYNMIFQINRLNGNPYVWNKLFKKNLLMKSIELLDSSISYIEDHVFIYSYLLQCEKIQIIDDCGYFYYFPSKRNDKYTLVEQIVGRLKALENAKILFEEEKYKDLLNTLIGQTYHSITMHLKERLVSNDLFFPYKLKEFMGKKVILYGAGNVGKSYYYSIVNNSSMILAAWVDKSASKLKEDELLPVEEVQIINDIVFDYIIVAVYDKPVYLQIEHELNQIGISKEKILWRETFYL